MITIKWNSAKNNYKGYIKKLKLFSISLEGNIYILYSLIPPLVVKEFDSLEEAQVYAQKILENFVKYISEET
jgi:hypothetical protein